MSFSRKTILTAVFAITVVASSVDTVNACGGRGRSSSSSRSYSSYSRYSAPSHSYGYSAPVQHYSTPSYRYSQPISVVRSQPIQQLQYQQAPAVQRIQTVSQQQPFQGGLSGVQQQTPQPSQRQLQVQQPSIQQPVQRSLQPAAAPQNAAQSALQALGGFAPPASTPVAPAVQPAPQPHVGSWTAALGNGSAVTLTLEEDGHFRWVATNKAGQASSFEGTYSITDGSLSLQRANDNQQLTGNMTTNGTDGFSFQVGGTNAAALNFLRS